jgi:hypothetical protein
MTESEKARTYRFAATGRSLRSGSSQPARLTRDASVPVRDLLRAGLTFGDCLFLFMAQVSLWFFISEADGGLTLCLS